MTDLQKLQTLSASQLESQTRLAVSREKEAVSNLITHLSEMERREYYAERAYPSLQAYCVEVLGYPSSSAYRRAAAAKFCREFPETLKKLASGELALTTVTELYIKRVQAKRNAKPKGKKSSTQGKSLSQSEAQPKLLENPASSEQAENAKSQEEKLPSEAPTSKRQTRSLIENLCGKSAGEARRELAEAFATAEAKGDGDSGSSQPPRGKEIPLSRKRTEIRVTLQKQDYEQFRRLKDLLGRKVPSGDPNEVFLYLVELGLDNHAPERKEARKKKRQKNSRSGNPKSSQKQELDASRNVAESPKTNPLKTSLPSSRKALVQASAQTLHRASGQTPAREPAQKPTEAKSKRTRTQRLKREAQMRDGLGCAARDPESGKRCGSQKFLKLHHIWPLAEGGRDELNNVQCLCHRHHCVWHKKKGQVSFEIGSGSAPVLGTSEKNRRARAEKG